MHKIEKNLFKRYNKKQKMKNLILFLSLVLMFSACRDDQDVMNTTPNVDPPKIKINSSVLGSVVNLEGDGVSDALVRYGNLSTFTDDFGVFSFKNVDLYQDGTYITVSKDGFFEGSRRFYPVLNETSHIKVQMLPKTIVGNFSATNGGVINSQGVNIQFSENAIVNQNTGNSYNGDVTVVMAWLDPTLQETFDQMPGDLTGIREDGSVSGLTSYGMIGVELIASNGDELQIKTGETASITMTVPVSLQSSAPASIPLWHFDEVAGIWVEEGSAELVNNQYIGEVSHFSFWNCDAPYPLVNLSGVFTSQGIEMENMLVEVEVVSNGSMGSGYTNSEGRFSGKVPADEALKVRAYDYCGQLVFGGPTIGPFGQDWEMNPQEVAFTSDIITVTGEVTNCNGDNVNESYAVVDYGGGIKTVISSDANNMFEGSFQNCQGSATVYGVDLTNDLISAGVVVDFVGDEDLGELEACDSFVSERFVAEFVGSTWNSITRPDTVMFTYNETVFDIGGGIFKYLYDITVIDWITGESITSTLLYKPADAGSGIKTGSLSMEFPAYGFSVAASEDVVELSQGAENYLKYQVTTTDITITDSTIFDPAITEVAFDIVLKLN